MSIVVVDNVVGGLLHFRQKCSVGGFAVASTTAALLSFREGTNQTQWWNFESCSSPPRKLYCIPTVCPSRGLSVSERMRSACISLPQYAVRCTEPELIVMRAEAAHGEPSTGASVREAKWKLPFLSYLAWPFPIEGQIHMRLRPSGLGVVLGGRGNPTSCSRFCFGTVVLMAKDASVYRCGICFQPSIFFMTARDAKMYTDGCSR